MRDICAEKFIEKKLAYVCHWTLILTLEGEDNDSYID